MTPESATDSGWLNTGRVYTRLQKYVQVAFQCYTGKWLDVFLASGWMSFDLHHSNSISVILHLSTFSHREVGGGGGAYPGD